MGIRVNNRSPITHYFIHLRPRSWAVVALHCAVGAIIAAPHEVFSSLSGFLGLIGASLLVAVGMNGGTLALNSAFDNDIMDIGYLDNPPPPPRGLTSFGLGVMATGLILSIVFYNSMFVAVYAFCFILSIIYSCPPFRIKAVAGGDIAINAAGYGALTPAAGYAAMAGTLSAPMIVISLGFAFLFAAFYPLTQIYQYKYDKSRGDRTFCVWLGPQRALLFSLVMLVTAFYCNFYVLFRWRASWIGGFMLLISAMFLWLALILRWIVRFKVFPHKQGMYEALYLWGLVDVIVILVFSGL